MNAVRAMAGRLGYAMRSRVARVGAIMCLVASLIFLAALFGVWWPAVSERSMLTERVEESRRAMVSAMEAAEVARQYEESARAIDSVERKLKASMRQAELVQDMSALARRLGVRIISESYEEGKPQGIYEPLVLQIALQARYSALRQFVNELGAMPVWIEVQDARVERARNTEGLVKAQLQLRVVRLARGSQ